MDETGERPGRNDTIAPQAFPLQWPLGRRRMHYWRRERGRFRTTFAKARDELVAECHRLGAAHVVVSTNLPLRRDGLPYADTREPTDPGVAVYFLLKGKLHAFSSDRWTTVAANMQAICLTLEAIRGMARWGAQETVDQAFRGFQALPAPATPQAEPWWVVMGYETAQHAEKMTSSESALRTRYAKCVAMLRSQVPQLGRPQGALGDALARMNAAYAARCRELDMSPWWEVLGVDGRPGVVAGHVIQDAYRRQCLKHHPDLGGSDQRMASINQAYEEAKAFLGVA